MLFRKPVKGDMVRYVGAQDCFVVHTDWRDYDYEKMKNIYEFVIVTPVPKPKETTLWGNVYCDTRNGLYLGSIYPDLKSSVESANSRCVGRVKIHLVEGEYEE